MITGMFKLEFNHTEKKVWKWVPDTHIHITSAHPPEGLMFVFGERPPPKKKECFL